MSAAIGETHTKANSLNSIFKRFARSLLTGKNIKLRYVGFKQDLNATQKKKNVEMRRNFD